MKGRRVGAEQEEEDDLAQRICHQFKVNGGQGTLGSPAFWSGGCVVCRSPLLRLLAVDVGVNGVVEPEVQGVEVLSQRKDGAPAPRSSTNGVPVAHPGTELYSIVVQLCFVFTFTFSF